MRSHRTCARAYEEVRRLVAGSRPDYDATVSAMSADDEFGRPAEHRATDDLGWGLAAALGLIAAAVAFVAIGAWLPGTNDPDSMSSVLYFQRIAAGQHLEVTVLTAPKPLMTLVFGLTWNLVHDWRAIVWETIAIHGIGVALAARLAGRVGGLAAGLCVAVALVVSAPELAEVSQANSLPWAFAGWLTAGVALTSKRPRYGIAGAALLLAGMARLETWLIVGAAMAVLVLLALPPVRRRAPGWPDPRSALPLTAGLLAVPVALIHDQLLTGNPLYWLTVADAYTALVLPGLKPVSLLEYGHSLLLRYGAMPLVLVLAAAGLAFLSATRRWALLVGVTSLIVGVLALLGVLAVRGTYISSRYYEQPNLALLVLAAVGLGGIVALIARLAVRRVPAPGVWFAGLAGAVVVGIFLSFPGPLTPQLETRLTALQRASADLDAVMPKLRQIVSSAGGPAPLAAPAKKGFTMVDPRRATAYVPRDLQRRVALELGVPLTMLADGTAASKISSPQLLLMDGQYVYHDINIDVPRKWFAGFEVASVRPLGTLRVVPLVSKPGAYWLVRIEGPAP